MVGFLRRAGGTEVAGRGGREQVKTATAAAPLIVATMATLELAAAPAEGQPVPVESQTGGPSFSSDSVVIHIYLHPAPLKLPISKPAAIKKQLSKLVQKGGSSEKEAAAFLASLEQAHNAVTTGA